VLAEMGGLFSDMGQLDRTHDAIQKRLAILERLGETHLRPETFNALADTAWRAKKCEEARSFAMQALTSSQTSGNRLQEGAALAYLGYVAFSEEHYSEALMHFEQSLRIHQEAGNQESAIGMIGAVGDVKRVQGDFSGSRTAYMECLAFSKRAKVSAANLPLRAFAELALAQGQVQRAARLIGALMALMEQAGHVSMPADIETIMAQICEQLPKDAVAWQEGCCMSVEEAIAYAEATEEEFDKQLIHPIG